MKHRGYDKTQIGSGNTVNYYFCDVCHYCFKAESMPDRCPDCGKATAKVKVCIGGKNKLRSVPAIRESTDTEAAEYERIKKEIEKELAAEEEQTSGPSDTSNAKTLRSIPAKSIWLFSETGTI